MALQQVSCDFYALVGLFCRFKKSDRFGRSERRHRNNRDGRKNQQDFRKRQNRKKRQKRSRRYMILTLPAIQTLLPGELRGALPHGNRWPRTPGFLDTVRGSGSRKWVYVWWRCVSQSKEWWASIGIIWYNMIFWYRDGLKYDWHCCLIL